MHRIIEQIRDEKEQLASGEFFRWLDTDDGRDQAKLEFIPAMYHYVMSFRDLLSLIAGPDDGSLQTAVNAYISEDASHFEWYLRDLDSLGRATFDPRNLWDQRLLPSRRAIYRMIGYAMEYEDVRLRVLLVMIFEATGEVFLRHTRRLVQRLGLDGQLGYFGTLHYEDELSHTVQMDRLADVVVEGPLYEIARRMVRDAFAEYHGLFESWRAAAVSAGPSSVFDGRELSRMEG